MRGVLIAMVALCGGIAATAQQQPPASAPRSSAPRAAVLLAEAAERARRAWSRHDAAALVADSPRLQLQLPGADPSAELGPAQAAAMITDYLAPAQEVETTIRAARETEPGRGYVEVRRRYRVAGTQEVRAQSVLFGYRLGATGWELVELRVIG